MSSNTTCWKTATLSLVQLDKAHPEVRRFAGWGLRSPLLATKYLGFYYSYFFVDGVDPRNPQTKYHEYSMNKSRFRGCASLNKSRFAHEM